MKEKIRALYKRPGKTLTETEIPNELEWLQGAVEGYIEAVPLRPDLVMIVNEEGKLHEMEHNFWINLGGYRDEILGPALFVGVDGEDFDDCPVDKEGLLDFLLEMEAQMGGGNECQEIRTHLSTVRSS